MNKLSVRSRPRAARILWRRRSGAKLSDLAAEFGVSKERIRQILLRARQREDRNLKEAAHSIGCLDLARLAKFDAGTVDPSSLETPL